jgi:hypothetical protein
MGNVTVAIGDSALTKNALNGFKEILKNCKLNLIKKEEKAVNRGSGGVLMKALSDKDIPIFNLLRMALSSVCLDKYSVLNEKNVNTDFNKKRKVNHTTEVFTASTATQILPEVFSQKRNLRQGYVSLR